MPVGVERAALVVWETGTSASARVSDAANWVTFLTKMNYLGLAARCKILPPLRRVRKRSTPFVNVNCSPPNPAVNGLGKHPAVSLEIRQLTRY